MAGPDFCTDTPPELPSRGGFLKELAGVDCAPDGARLPGTYVRLYPQIMFGCGTDPEGCPAPGAAGDIAKAIAGWLCEWGVGYESEPLEDQQPDGFLDICDNCPRLPNPFQRDCNRNGIGDVCERYDGYYSLLYCAGLQQDTDKDGVCDEIDECPNGDDCLVRHWAERAGCSASSDLSACGCDCDSDGAGDLCQAAVDLEEPTLPYYEDGIDTDYNGLPDCAEGSDPVCRAVPAACGADNTYEWMLDLSEFDGIEQDAGAALAWLTDRGWTLGTPLASGMVEFRSEEGEPVALRLDGGALYDDGEPVEWPLKTPAFVPPAVRWCEPAHADNCAPSNAPYIGDWSFMAIELEIALDNGAVGGRN